MLPKFKKTPWVYKEDGDGSISRSSKKARNVSPTPEQQQRKQQKVVRFSARNETRPTISFDDLSEDECLAVWYTDDEFDEIRNSCFKQIQMIEEGRPLRDKKYCARGLEGFTKTGALLKRGNRSLSIRLALDQQETLRREPGSPREEEAIALVYRNASMSSQLWAHRIGCLDARVAEVHATMDEMDEGPPPSRPKPRAPKRIGSIDQRAVEETFVSLGDTTDDDDDDDDDAVPLRGGRIPRRGLVRQQAASKIFAMMDKMDDTSSRKLRLSDRISAAHDLASAAATAAAAVMEEPCSA